MSIKILTNAQTIQQIKKIEHNNPIEVIKASVNSSRIKSLPDIMDESITELLNSSSVNVAAKIKFHKIINKALPQIMRPENYINKGRESKVYRISDNFVLKVSRGKVSENALSFYNIATTPSKEFNKLKIYFGEPLIKLGNVDILKNATPSANFKSCGIPYTLNRGEFLSDHIEKYNKEYIPLVASLPQASFDEFAHDLKLLNGMKGNPFSKNKYFTPDVINPNNILICDNKIRIVDKLEKTNIKEPNTLFTMLDPLLIRYTPEKYAQRSEDLLEPRSKIFKKCLIAAEKAGLPLEFKLPSYMHDEQVSSLWAIKEIVPSEHYAAVDGLSRLREITLSMKERLDYINKVIPD